MTALNSEAGAPTRRRRRRWPYIVGGVIAALTTVGLVGGFVWLPNHRPALEAGERYGIDVSNHQGDIDWERVAGDGMEFAYIKATEGADFIDASFERNWAGAGAAGLDRGAYHFFTLCRSGAEQAANFLGVVPSDPEALPPVIDLELTGNCSQRPDRDHVLREVLAFVDSVEEATGQTVVLYILDDFESHYPVRDQLDRPIWHRSILRRPNIEGWWAWQVQAHASIDGIDRRTDLNVMRGERPPATDP